MTDSPWLDYMAEALARSMPLTEALAVALAAMDDRASWLEEDTEHGTDEEAEALTAAYLTLKALHDRLAS